MKASHQQNQKRPKGEAHDDPVDLHRRCHAIPSRQPASTNGRREERVRILEETGEMVRAPVLLYAEDEGVHPAVRPSPG